MLHDTTEEECSKIGNQVVIAFSTSSDNNVDGVSIPDELVASLCEGIPRQLWVEKCVVLHRADGVLVAKRICCNVSSNIVIGSIGLLKDSHVAIQISSSLSMADVPDDWRYSI